MSLVVRLNCGNAALERALPRGHGPVADRKELGLSRQALEVGGVGAGKPGLGAEPEDLFVERRAPRRVEMRRHLVEQQHRRRDTLQRQEARVSQQDGDQQRLLLSRRAELRSNALGGVVHQQVRRSEENTSELQSLMRISYAVFCLK